MKLNTKAQQVIEYLLMVVALVAGVLAISGPNGPFHNAVERSLNYAVNGIYDGYLCSPPGPNSSFCPGATTGLASDTITTYVNYRSCDTTTKCLAQCVSTSSYAAASGCIRYQCLGGDPNATTCPNNCRNLTSDRPFIVAANCDGQTCCQQVCKAGFTLTNGVCE